MAHAADATLQSHDAPIGSLSAVRGSAFLGVRYGAVRRRSSATLGTWIATARACRRHAGVSPRSRRRTLLSPHVLCCDVTRSIRSQEGDHTMWAQLITMTIKPGREGDLQRASAQLQGTERPGT